MKLLTEKHTIGIDVGTSGIKVEIARAIVEGIPFEINQNLLL